MSEPSTATATVEAPTIPEAVAASLPTPCLVVDLAACERNIERAASYFANTHAKLRPHFKAHKCTTLLARQLEAGSCAGVTCATAAEALLLSEAGFEDILVANQVVDPPALSALTRAAARSDVMVAVDHHDHIDLLARAAKAEGVEVGILLEIDVGMDRCGLAPGDDGLLRLAEAVDDRERLTLRGLQGYEGHAVLRPTRAERAEHVALAAEILSAARDRLIGAGYPCPIVSGGGTGTYDLAADAGILDEIQAGSYALMDARYATLDLPFENALFMLTTVISHRRPNAATVNAGLKALTVEYGMAQALRSGLSVLKLADEHAWLSVSDDTPVAIGDQVFLVPAHIDPAINLHDVLFVWDGRSARVQTWAVDGRRTEAMEALL